MTATAEIQNAQRHYVTISNLPQPRRLSNTANSRSRNLYSQLPMKPLRLLQRLQPSNSPAIFNPIRKECRQDLDLLSGKELRRECSDHSSEIGHGFAPQYRIFIVYIFAQGLHDFDQGGLFILDICNMENNSQSDSSTFSTDSIGSKQLVHCTALTLSNPLSNLLRFLFIVVHDQQKGLQGRHFLFAIVRATAAKRNKQSDIAL